MAPVKISPKNEQAVLSQMAKNISKADAAKIVKTVGGTNGKVNTKNELAQLKAIQTKYATAFSADAKKLIEKEIESASKAIKETTKSTRGSSVGWTSSGASVGSGGGGSVGSGGGGGS
jgi:hypothetical protein